VRNYDAIAAQLDKADGHTLPFDPLQLVDLKTFVTRPSIRWLVGDAIPGGSLGLMFGAPKSGKTFAALDLLMHAAHGLDWHGHKVTRPLRIAYLAGEGINGLRLRIRAWAQHHDSATLGGDFRFVPVSFSLPDRAEEVIELLRDYRPDVLVTDTLNAYFTAGGDDGKTGDMTVFVSAIRRIRDALDCAVLVIHHSPVGDATRERGSVVLRGSMDVVFQVARDAEGSDAFGVQLTAARDVETWVEPLALRLQRFETDWLDEDGEPMSTCIVTASEEPVTLPGRVRKEPTGTPGQLWELVQSYVRDHYPGQRGIEVLVPRSAISAELRKLNSKASHQSITNAWAALEKKRRLRRSEPDAAMVKV
jgi:hypothetical protein